MKKTESHFLTIYALNHILIWKDIVTLYREKGRKSEMGSKQIILFLAIRKGHQKGEISQATIEFRKGNQIFLRDI